MLVNLNKILKYAKDEHFAVAHFNINNLEWTKYILEECQKLNVPVILGVSEGAVKYMGGFDVVVNIVESLMKDLKITIFVCLHLDHGSTIENCKKAIDAGFSSVMIDASKHGILDNISITKEVVKYAHKKGVTVEAEVGHISNDGLNKTSSNATLEDCLQLYENTNIDALAPALGSVHGFYKGEANLDFSTMKKINEKLPIPLVLHGGTGIPDEKIEKAIACGISKININTDLQATWNKTIREFIKENEDVYDPRKIIGSGETAIKKRIDELVELFKTQNMERYHK